MRDTAHFADKEEMFETSPERKSLLMSRSVTADADNVHKVEKLRFHKSEQEEEDNFEFSKNYDDGMDFPLPKSKRAEEDPEKMIESYHMSYDNLDNTQENTQLFVVPEDKKYLVLICFFLIGFVAWFPCFQIFVALPFYTQRV